MHSNSVRGSYRNRLLALLPAASIEQLAPHLTPVDLPVNRTLQRPGEKMESVYFLEDGICSMVVPMSSGATWKWAESAATDLSARLRSWTRPRRPTDASWRFQDTVTASRPKPCSSIRRGPPSCAVCCCAACSCCWCRRRKPRRAIASTSCRNAWRAGF